ncbi:MAG: hypothetical protein AAGK22_17055 [Acidobacteriota bacterium]
MRDRRRSTISSSSLAQPVQALALRVDDRERESRDDQARNPTAVILAWQACTAPTQGHTRKCAEQREDRYRELAVLEVGWS